MYLLKNYGSSSFCIFKHCKFFFLLASRLPILFLIVVCERMGSITGGFHQGDARLTHLSRGRQFSFIALSALVNSQCWPVHTWTQIMIDNILIHGDYLYPLQFVTNAIPDSSALLVNNLPSYSISIDGSCWAIAYENPHQGRISATTN